MRKQFIKFDSRFASKLLDQQMWCFGQDIRRPEGNLLTLFGFQRMPNPDHSKSTAYVLNSEIGLQITLWGFGLFAGTLETGGVFLRRFQFRPVWTNQTRLDPMVWEPTDVPCHQGNGISENSQRQMLISVLSWLASYEMWVNALIGDEYREATLRSWPKAVVAGSEMSNHWHHLAGCADDILK